MCVSEITVNEIKKLVAKEMHELNAWALMSANLETLVCYRLFSAGELVDDSWLVISQEIKGVVGVVAHSGKTW